MARRPNSNDVPTSVEPPAPETYDWATFQGWSVPTYTQTPDELFDIVMAHLTGAELKVLLYIIRRTFGFKKAADAISLEQICHGIITRSGRRLDYGTGLKRSTVLEALRSLREKRLILARQTHAESGSLAATIYALHFQGPTPSDDEDPRVQGHGHGHAPNATGPDQVVRQSRLPGPPEQTTWSARADELVRQGGRDSSARVDQQQTGNKQTDNKPPIVPQRGTTASWRKRRRDEAERDPARYSRGPYGVCALCGCSPHDPECSLAVQEKA